jgi:hypothetical protein
LFVFLSFIGFDLAVANSESQIWVAGVKAIDGLMNSLSRIQCIDENYNSRNAIIDEYSSLKDLDQFRNTMNIAKQAVFIDLISSEKQPPTNVTENTHLKLYSNKSLLANNIVPTVNAGVLEAAKIGKPRASKSRQSKQPSISRPVTKLKAEKEFEKLSIASRVELLKRWNEEIPVDVAMVQSNSNSIESTKSNVASEEVELSNLRVQLGEVCSRIQEFQIKEKRLKSAIKKLQRKVCALHVSKGSQPFSLNLAPVFLCNCTLSLYFF